MYIFFRQPEVFARPGQYVLHITLIKVAHQLHKLSCFFLERKLFKKLLQFLFFHFYPHLYI